jgi:CxC1 like cysteine cluster associated with KDZ transposases
MLCRSSRAKHLTTSGLGKHYTSPTKARDKRKSGKRVIPLGNATKHRLLLQKLESLRKKPQTDQDEPEGSMGWEDLSDSIDQSMDIDPDAGIHEALQAPKLGTTEPERERAKLSVGPSLWLHASWAEVLPGLLSPLLEYISSSVGIVIPPADDLHAECALSCVPKHTKILCLYFDREYLLLQFSFAHHLSADFRSINVVACKCHTTLQVLVKHGLFPTSPSQPRMAVSIDLLDFYRALFERSCDAITAISGALHTFYSRRGFHMLTKKVCPVTPVMSLILYVFRVCPLRTRFAEALAMLCNGMTACASAWRRRSIRQSRSLTASLMPRLHANQTIQVLIPLVPLSLHLRLYLHLPLQLQLRYALVRHPNEKPSRPFRLTLLLP